MESSSILCNLIPVQTFQYAPKALHIYVLFTWYLYKIKQLLFFCLLIFRGFLKKKRISLQS